jgi:acyl transferase domain-containing protein
VGSVIETGLVVDPSIGEIHWRLHWPGVFSLEDATRLVAAGRLIRARRRRRSDDVHRCARGQVITAVAPHAASVSIAAAMAPKSVVIARKEEALVLTRSELPCGARDPAQATRGLTRAFHSPLMDAMLGLSPGSPRRWPSGITPIVRS